MSIKKYQFGKSIITNSTVLNIDSSNISELKELFNIKELDDKIEINFKLDSDTKIYGLGENVKGINKRGSNFISFNMDDPNVTEDRRNLYASHNFLIISSKNNNFGIFVDTPKVVEYDLGFFDLDLLKICTSNGFDLYLITPEKEDFELDIIRQFRTLIGKSYIAPFWSFGVAQSRWGYKSKSDLEEVIGGFQNKNFPLDMLFIDIDCLDDFKDFTFNQTFYKDGKIDKSFFDDLKKKNIHLVVIVDAAVRKEEGYFLYDELIKNKGYCFDKDGNPYIVGVWPGDSILPDYMSEVGQEIFSRGYQKYLDLGIDGFWNDMNEPALFYSRPKIDELGAYFKSLDFASLKPEDFYVIRGLINNIKNNDEDYHNITHKYDLEYAHDNIFSHYDLHNMYGYKMVESGYKYFKKYNEEHNLKKNYLIFSRSSMIGSHRYGGIWTGDNAAYWDHLLLNIRMMPSLNMCGYLYSGADIGGFGHNASEDLLLRWMAFGLFTPLFRNHTCNWVRPKDYHLMQRSDIIRNLLSIRYAILPYLFSEYIKVINNNSLLFTPLSFKYRLDKRCEEIDDELIFGSSILLAPVYKQNADGRMVYLPEDALEIRMKSGAQYVTKRLEKGDHYVSIGIDEVVFYLLEGEVLPLTKIKNINEIKNVSSLDYSNCIFINNGSNKREYEMYTEENEEIKMVKLEVR